MIPVLMASFFLGMAGSAHCIGMCGPIALAVPSPPGPWYHRFTSTLLLNSGRLTTYALLGAAFGVFGQGLRLAGLMQGVSIVAGSLLLLAVAVPSALERWVPAGRSAMFIGRLRGLFARNLARTAPEALFLTGVLNGLLPCGLVYAALITAVAGGSIGGGVAVMIFFGIGTWPALFALRMSGGLIGNNLRARLRRVSPALVSVVGILMILRGLGLGIPMLSPPPTPPLGHITSCH